MTHADILSIPGVVSVREEPAALGHVILRITLASKEWREHQFWIEKSIRDQIDVGYTVEILFEEE